LERTIGLKIADGTFYPVLEEGFYGDKRLVLTTVRDDQAEVHVDLYQGGVTAGIQGSRYIGSLVIENIRKGAKGSPDIELIIGANPDGNLNVSATDRSTGEEQSLSVSLRAMEEGPEYEVPDFEPLERPEPVEPAAPGVSARPEAVPDHAVRDPEDQRVEPRRNVALIVVLIVFVLAALGAGAFFLIRSLTGRSAPLPEPPPRMAPEPQATLPEPEVAPVAATPDPDPVQPVVAEPAPVEPAASAAKAGVQYRIKWGDTLWDLSSTYYRDPWLYPRIAKANNIPNPDLIFAGTTINIPER
jgi:nucleoid-associated protein YgaU